MSDAFDTAWEIAKADTGMWDEIYAPLYDVFGGERGRNTDKHAFPLDFIQTKDVPLERHYGGKNAMALLPHHQGYVEDIPGGVSIPMIGSTPDGWQINEGNHRVHALRRLNAPYIPAYSQATEYEKPKPFSPDLPMGAEMRRWTGNSQERPRDPYGFQSRLREGKFTIPPSFLFGRELVPGMGKLIPDLPKELSASDMPLDEIRGLSKLRDWQDYPKWKKIDLDDKDY